MAYSFIIRSGEHDRTINYMITKPRDWSFSELKKQVDWKLLLFLVLFLNIRMPVKIAALAFIYLSRFNFKFGFKLKNSRLPLFYLFIILIAIAGFLINGNYINNYLKENLEKP